MIESTVFKVSHIYLYSVRSTNDRVGRDNMIAGHTQVQLVSRVATPPLSSLWVSRSAAGPDPRYLSDADRSRVDWRAQGFMVELN